MTYRYPKRTYDRVILALFVAWLGCAIALYARF